MLRLSLAAPRAGDITVFLYDLGVNTMPVFMTSVELGLSIGFVLTLVGTLWFCLSSYNSERQISKSSQDPNQDSACLDLERWRERS